MKQVLGDVHCLVGEKESVDTIMITPGTCILPSSGNFILIIIFPCFSDVYSLCIIVPFTVISVCDLKDKVQRVTVIQKGFVGVSASCSIA